MASHIYECAIDSVVRGHLVCNTVWNLFVGVVLAVAVTTYNSNKSRGIYLRVVFITIILVCYVATNQGQLLFTVQRLT